MRGLATSESLGKGNCMHRRIHIVILFVCFTLVGGLSCKKPRKFVRTKQQQERVDQAILSAAPVPRFPVGANFGDKVRLVGVDISPANPVPGGKITLDFYWEALDEVSSEGDWMIFVHLEGPTEDGSVARVLADHYAVEDGPGGAGLYPVSEWSKGEVIKDSKTVDLVDPRGRKVGPGEVKLYTGIFDAEAYRTREEDVRLELVNTDAVKHDGRGRLEAAAFMVGTIAPFEGPELQVRRAIQPLTIDGKLDEAAWSAAMNSPAFGTTHGLPAPQGTRTQTKLLWDDEALYIGFMVADSDIRSDYTERDDELWKSDVVEVYLDPDADGQQYIELQLSPNNVVFDALFRSHRAPPWEEARGWNMTGLQSATSRGTLPGRPATTGWFAEIRIPWADLSPANGAKPEINSRWRANFFRVDQSEAGIRNVSWSPVSTDPNRADFHNLDRAGTLIFADTPAALRNRILQRQPPAAIPAPQPTEAPAQPGVAPAQPTVAPAQPGAAPAQPTVAPAQPSAVPAQPSAAPAAAQPAN